MIHPYTKLKFIHPSIGYGVVATQLIPAGTITWVMDKLDRIFTLPEVQKLPVSYQDILEIYSFRNSNGNYVLCWDNEKYINHSFKPSCLITAYDFQIAIRDIHIGEELTDDYGYLNISEPFEAKDEGTERKIVYPDDLLKYYTMWDEQLLAVFDKIPLVNQPLRPFINDKLWKKITAIATGELQMDSILTNYYQANPNSDKL